MAFPKPKGTWTHADPHIEGALHWQSYALFQHKVAEIESARSAKRLEKLKVLSPVLAAIMGLVVALLVKKP